MELKNFFAQDLQGSVIPSPSVYLYAPGTTTLATGLKDKDGNYLTNPFTGTTNGQVVVAAPDGDYDMRVVGSGRDFTMRVRFIDSIAGSANILRADLASTASGKGAAMVGFKDQTVKSYLESGLMVECADAASEAAAWASGALIVIRTDLLQLEAQVAHLAMDGANGGAVFSDFSATPKSVIRTGSPTTTTSSKKFGLSSMDYSGAGNYLEMVDCADFRLYDTWTIECWHRLKTNHLSSTHSFICSKGTPGDLSSSWFFALMAGGYIAFSSGNNIKPIYVAYPHATDTANFHHLSLNCINNVVTLYVDGVALGSATLGAGGFPLMQASQNFGNLLVGGWNYGAANTEGDYLDDFVITKGVALRSGNFTPPISAATVPVSAVAPPYLPTTTLSQGTWTPVFTFNTPGNLAVTYNNQVGRWSKVGKLVTVTVFVDCNITHSTASSIAKITGLDASLIGIGGQFSAIGAFQGFTSSGYSQLGFQMAGTAELYITKSGPAQAFANAGVADFATGSNVKIFGSITYMLP